MSFWRTLKRALGLDPEAGAESDWHGRKLEAPRKKPPREYQPDPPRPVVDPREKLDEKMLSVWGDYLFPRGQSWCECPDQGGCITGCWAASGSAYNACPNCGKMRRGF